MTLLMTRKTNRLRANHVGGVWRHGNQQCHVTAAESRRWRDVINRDFPRDVADQRHRATAIKAIRSTRKGVGHVCSASEHASEQTNERQQSATGAAAAAAAAGDELRVGGVNHANAPVTAVVCWTPALSRVVAFIPLIDTGCDTRRCADDPSPALPSPLRRAYLPTIYCCSWGCNGRVSTEQASLITPRWKWHRRWSLARRCVRISLIDNFCS